MYILQVAGVRRVRLRGVGGVEFVSWREYGARLVGLGVGVSMITGV